MKINAYAKINLFLDVLGRRPNGYHDVSMIMQSVGLYDTLDISLAPDNRIDITSDNASLPCDESNIIYKTVVRLREHSNRDFGAIIRLNKRIPMAAGMAGGSADAAATLIGLNKLLSLGLTTEELCDIGVTIGADVPFCIVGGTYRCEGIGEVMTKIDTPESKTGADLATGTCLVIAKPDIDISTATVYRQIDSEGEHIHPPIDRMISAITDNDVSNVSAALFNRLEAVTVKDNPIIQQMKDILIREGAEGAMMSGSGPTVFGLFTDRDTAEAALAVLHEEVAFAAGSVTQMMDHGIEIID
ncbi:MAG: 4-(cytidine 5'-diphospho)-2-C-methyl-D-erythritol kinase [Lachnospiraceae bacterium]|nr:4-(cytidine 5'-diphospho)-2-C-methyl-D-erythritol kinase [Lachnospiraceae bacterium]